MAVRVGKLIVTFLISCILLGMSFSLNGCAKSEATETYAADETTIATSGSNIELVSTTQIENPTTDSNLETNISTDGNESSLLNEVGKTDWESSDSKEPQIISGKFAFPVGTILTETNFVHLCCSSDTGSFSQLTLVFQPGDRVKSFYMQAPINTNTGKTEFKLSYNIQNPVSGIYQQGYAANQDSGEATYQQEHAKTFNENDILTNFHVTAICGRTVRGSINIPSVSHDRLQMAVECVNPDSGFAFFSSQVQLVEAGSDATSVPFSITVPADDSAWQFNCRFYELTAPFLQNNHYISNQAVCENQKDATSLIVPPAGIAGIQFVLPIAETVQTNIHVPEIIVKGSFQMPEGIQYPKGGFSVFLAS